MLVATDSRGETWAVERDRTLVVTWASLSAAGTAGVHARAPGVVAVIGLAGRAVVGGIVLAPEAHPEFARTPVRRSHAQVCPALAVPRG